MTAQAARSLFAESLRELQSALEPALDASSRAFYRREFQLIDRNALQLGVAAGEATPDGRLPGTYYFDPVTTREIVLRDGFLTAWSEMFRALGVSDPERQKIALQLFILHELIHIPQNLDSPTHEGVRQHQAILRTVDYHADAFAILLCFDLLRRRRTDDWRELLAKVIEANLLAIAVFEFYSFGRSGTEVAPAQYPFDRMLASRLLRHLTWHYQHHRARSMPAGCTLDDFDIKREPILSIQWLMDDSRTKRGITVDWPSTRPDAELWIADRDSFGLPVVHRHRATKSEEKWGDLFRGLFAVDVSLSYKFFNELLTRTREVVTWQEWQQEQSAAPAAAPASPTLIQTAQYVINATHISNTAIGDNARAEKSSSD